MRKELKIKRHPNASKNSYWSFDRSPYTQWWDGVICPQGLQTAVGKIPLSVQKCTIIFSDRKPAQGKPTYFYPIPFLRLTPRNAGSNLVYKNRPENKRWTGYMTPELKDWLYNQFTFKTGVPKILWVGVYWYDD